MKSATEGVLIIGMGNEFRGDDAAGLLAARRLAGKENEMEMAGVTVLELSGDGTRLLETWRDAGKVIIIDAVSSGAAPGTVHRVRSGQLEGLKDLTTLSTHGFGLLEAVRFSAALGQLPPELIIYGIEGKSFDHGLEQSPEVAMAVDQLVNRILEEVRCTSTALPGT